MIETTDEAVTYLEMVARRESGDLAEAALIVTRTLRQATQTLADHAQAAGAPGVHEGDGAGVSNARAGLRIMAECIERGLAMIGKDETEMLVKRQDAEDIRTVLVAMETPLPTGAGVSDEALRRLAEEWVREEFEQIGDDPQAWSVIADLRAEVERLKAERDSADRGVARNAEKAAEMMRERDKARAERDRDAELLARICESEWRWLYSEGLREATWPAGGTADQQTGVRVHLTMDTVRRLRERRALAFGEESREPGVCLWCHGPVYQEYDHECAKPASAGPAEEPGR